MQLQSGAIYACDRLLRTLFAGRLELNEGLMGRLLWNLLVFLARLQKCFSLPAKPVLVLDGDSDRPTARGGLGSALFAGWLGFAGLQHKHTLGPGSLGPGAHGPKIFVKISLFSDVGVCIQNCCQILWEYFPPIPDPISPISDQNLPDRIL